MDDIILIRAQSKSGGLTSLVAGGIALVIGAMIMLWLPPELRLAGIFVISGAIVCMLIGWFKIREPEHSLQLSKSSITYLHRHGSWQLGWNNIVRVDVPRIYRKMQHQPLAMIGIRIQDYDEFLANASPRLMNNILMEQRSLLIQAFKDQFREGTKSINDYADYLVEDTNFTSENGQKYTGLQAMFANRMLRMREGFGYDLFIGTTELDRSADEFVQLLKECKSAAH